MSAKEVGQTRVERRLEELRIELPAAPRPFGSYVEAVQSGSLLFLSGMLPVLDHKPTHVGLLGRDFTINQGKSAARIAALNAIAAAKEHLGSLERILRVVRHGVFMATFGDFLNHPEVADGASDLFRDLFGPGNTSARLVLGVASLPLGVPVELEVTFEIRALRGKPQG